MARGRGGPIKSKSVKLYVGSTKANGKTGGLKGSGVKSTSAYGRKGK